MRCIRVVLQISLMVCMAPSISLGAVASWYDSNSVKKEGTCHADKCYTASGAEAGHLDRIGFLYAASNDFKLGTMLKVCREGTQRCVSVQVLDRGGFKKYGRRIDLCKKAFGLLAPTRLGLLKVTITEVSHAKN
jgi:rare lipoprotein A (peptidoglycan hydrolase)